MGKACEEYNSNMEHIEITHTTLFYQNKHLRRLT